MDLIIAVRIPTSSLASVRISFRRSSGTASVASNNLSQYRVSRASLQAMEILDKKSALLCPPCASSTLAPIDVPDRISCLLNVRLTPACSSRNLHSFTIRTEKSNVLSQISFFKTGTLPFNSLFKIPYSKFLSAPRLLSPASPAAPNRPLPASCQFASASASSSSLRVATLAKLLAAARRRLASISGTLARTLARTASRSSAS